MRIIACLTTVALILQQVSAFYFADPAKGGAEIIDIDSLLGSKGLFPKRTLPISLSYSISSSVTTFRDMLRKPDILNSAYEKYARRYNKKSNPARKRIFKSRLLTIFAHNLRAKKGEETFTMGINQFSDMTLEEVKEKYTGVIFPSKTRIVQDKSPNLKLPHKRSKRQNAPISRDWRLSGVVTPPKDQRDCGSCTIFALTGALESAMAIYRRNMNLDLSEQELLDCPTGAGVKRCNGNWPEDIYEYQRNQGQTSESLYQYQAKDGTCRAAGKPRFGKVQDYYRATKGSEAAMKDYVGNYGPSSVIITLDNGFMNYLGGVMNTPCASTTLDHSVLAVGYGSENGLDYWIIKNSWGTGWGDGGFIKMARNAGNMCQIADYVILPTA